jgi:peptide deformylase
MDTLKIRVFPDVCLKKKAAKISSVGEKEKKMLDEMAATMYLNSGVGLAAVQVGIDKQLAVIDVGTGLIKLINPEIIKCEGSQSEEEGCLSVPGVAVKVKRAKKVTVRFLNEEGLTVQVRAEGLLSRAMQHEIDHLCGILIIDRLNPIKKMFLKKKAPKASRP